MIIFNFLIIFQGGWQGRTQVLHRFHLLFRALEARNAQGHGEDDARSWKEGKKILILHLRFFILFIEKT